MKILIRTALSLALLAAGFAAGFPVGKDAGFTIGSEWALMQANLIAREAGVFMPVYLEEGQFRVVIRQPKNIYKRAWQLADEEAEKVSRLNRKERTLPETLVVAGSVSKRPGFRGAFRDQSVFARSLRGTLPRIRGEVCRSVSCLQHLDNGCTDLFVRQVVTCQNNIGILPIQREPFREQVVDVLVGPFGKTARREIADPRAKGAQGDAEKHDDAVLF